MEFVSDQPANLDESDIRFMKGNMRVQIRQWTTLCTVIAVLALIWQEVTLTYAITSGIIYAFGVAAIIGGCFFQIDRSRKYICRGIVTSRFRVGEEGETSRNKYASDRFRLEVNGKLLTVDKDLYEQYFKRDVVEFHYLESGAILQHRLLAREGKPFTGIHA